jgi:hypothetical protein
LKHKSPHQRAFVFQKSVILEKNRRLNPPGSIRLELRLKSRKPHLLQRRAHLAHEVQVVVQVVDGGEHGAEHFAAAVQVVQVGA